MNIVILNFAIFILASVEFHSGHWGSGGHRSLWSSLLYTHQDFKLFKLHSVYVGTHEGKERKKPPKS